VKRGDMVSDGRSGEQPNERMQPTWVAGDWLVISTALHPADPERYITLSNSAPMN